MTYRFKLDEPVADGFRRIAIEQIEMAEAKLAGEENIASAIHDARRCLKRLRALLGLIRPALDEATYRRETERLSGIGHLLADARDMDVMRQTLAKLEARPESLPEGLAGPLQKLLTADPVPCQGTDARHKALVRLKQARKLFTSKAVQAIVFDDLVAGMEFGYRKARRRFRRAYHKPSDDSFHAWRKAVQLHWRHMALLSRGWPEALSARAAEAKELSRLLGEDHDHSILIAFAADRGAALLAPEQLALLTERCRSCQSEFRDQAKPRGARLFAETADNLTQRIQSYWASAEHLAALTPAQEPKATRRILRKPKSSASLRRQAR